MQKKIPTKKNIGCIKFRDPGMPNVTPTIMWLNGSTGISNSTTIVYVNGINFLEDAVVYFSGQPCDTFFNTPRQVFFYVPSYPLTGSYNVTVYTAGMYSNTVTYNVI